MINKRIKSPYFLLFYFGFIFILNILLMCKNYNYDTISLAEWAERGSWYVEHQQTHILLTTFNSLFYKLWVLFGYRGNALFPLQLLTCFFGALSVTSFFVLLEQLFKNKLTAIFGSLGLAFSVQFWRYSSLAETHIIPATLLIVAIIFLVKFDEKKSHKSIFFSGLFTGLSVFFSGANIIFLFAFLGFILASEFTFRDRLKYAGLYLSAVVLFWLIPFMVVGLAIFLRNFNNAYNQPYVINDLIIFYSTWLKNNLYKDNFRIYNAFIVLKSIASSIISGKDNHTKAIIVYGLIALTFVSTYKKIFKKYLNTFIFLLIAFLTFLIVFSFYEPHNKQRYVPLLPIIWIFVSFFANEILYKKSNLLIKAIPFLSISLLFINNLIFSILPWHSEKNNFRLQEALFIKENSKPTDKIIIRGDAKGPKSAVLRIKYLPYFAKREIVSLEEVKKDANRHGYSKKSALYTLRKRIDSELESGIDIFILEDVFMQYGLDDNILEKELKYKDFADFLNFNYDIKNCCSFQEEIIYKIEKEKNRIFWHGDRNVKKVALTFDDGPNEPFTSEILDILEKQNVKATFFVMGKNAERFPETLIRIFKGGHDIGNHSYAHPDFDKITDKEIKREISRTEEIINDIINKDVF